MPSQVVLVTSTVAGEGKSTIANNLASSLTSLERVLLIDADMRQPTLSLNFDFPPDSPGLANVIAGTARLEDCIVSVGNLDMLPAGNVCRLRWICSAAPRLPSPADELTRHASRRRRICSARRAWRACSKHSSRVTATSSSTRRLRR